MDARNAALALCDRLSRTRQERMKRENTEGQKAARAADTSAVWPDTTINSAVGGTSPANGVSDFHSSAANSRASAGATASVRAENLAGGTAPADVHVEPSGRRAGTSDRRSSVKADLPREIFLPAIDPLPYVTAAMKNPDDGRETPTAGDRPLEDRKTAGCSDKGSSLPADTESTTFEAEGATSPSGRRDAVCADRLRPLAWPRGFENLKQYFETNLPCALFDLPGWRFVRVEGADGLWIGVYAQDGRIRQIAYARSGATPPRENGLYRPARGLDGRPYQVLWQRL